jgi:replicative superfamily II helicase
MAAKWNKRKFFNEVSLRISYGVKKELVAFCKLPDVGKVRAQRLYAAGFRSPKDLIGRFSDVKKALNMKDEKISEILTNAEKLS